MVDYTLIGSIGGGSALLIFILWLLFRDRGGRLQEDKKEGKEEKEIEREGKEEIKMDIDINNRCKESYKFLRKISKKCRRLGLQMETEKNSQSLVNIERALKFLESSNGNDAQAKVSIREIHQNSNIYLTQLVKLLPDIKPTGWLQRRRLRGVRKLAVKVYNHLKHIETEVEIRAKINAEMLRNIQELERRVEKKAA